MNKSKRAILIAASLFGLGRTVGYSQCSPTTSNLTCTTPVNFNITATGYVGNTPTSGDAGCNPCCYTGSDLDCDGLQDVPFSVENSKWYQYCNTSGSTIVIDLSVDEPGGGGTCNLQGAVWVGASFSSAVIDCGNAAYDFYDSNPGGAADGFTFNDISIPAGQCAYVMTDGYGGSTCTGVTATITCPCVPPTITVTPSAPSICPGGSVTLTASGASTYVWSPSTGLSATTGTSVTASPTTTTVYTVTGTDGTGCSNTTTVTVTVLAAPTPNAGTDATICQGGSATIGNNPVFTQEGASYSWNNGAGSGILDLSGGGQDNGTKVVSPASTTTYTLTVTNLAGCSATDAVVVNVVTPANAGSNGTLTTCSTSSSSNLFASLGGSPQAGGSWSGPSALTGGSLGTYDPASCSPGTYTYTVTGTSPCPNATATVVVTENAAPNAGTNGSTTVCSNGAAVNLFSLLGGSPSSGGAWTGPSALTGGSSGTFTPGTNAAGTYTYTVTGTAPCANATATVTVSVTAAPNAGTGNTLTTCSNSAPTNLFSLLGGTPSTSGTWTGPSALSGGHLGTYDPSTCVAGTYTYTVSGTSPCVNATATITVTENLGPNAGTDGAVSFCPSDPITNLYGELGGSPSATGTWSGPSALGGGQLGAFNPATMLAGTYTYTVTGAGCPNATADVIVGLSSSFDATISAAGPYCSNAAAVTLTAADPGGTWSGTGITDPVNGVFNPATAGAGTHTITYSIPGGCGDTDTENFTVTAADNAGFSYPSSNYCTGDTDPVATVSGLGGGTFSINNGGTINAGNGTVDLSVSGAGSYTITYTTNGACPNSSSQNITIGVTTDATITPVGSFCQDAAAFNLSAADAGGTWSGTGITDAVNGLFDPTTAGPGTHTITYTISGLCGDTDTEDILINPSEDATFSYPAGGFCTSDANPTATVSGTLGGSFTIDNGGTIDVSTGEIDLIATGPGSFIVTYTTSGPCPDASSFAINIVLTPDVTIDPIGPFCDNDLSVNMTAATGGGVWAGTGITDAGVGTFDPLTAGAGTHTISYSVAGACPNTDTEDVLVNATDDASFSYATNNYCLTEPAQTPTVTGLVGGAFSIDNGGVIDASTGTIDPAVLGQGTFTVTYTTNGACPTSSTYLIVIADAFDASINNPGILCENGGVVTLTAGDPGGEWTGSGITDINAGTFDPALVGPGTSTVTYTISGACGSSDQVFIDVLAADDAGFGYSQSNYCVSEGNPTPTITGLTGGTFSMDNGGVIDPLTGEIDIAASGLGTYIVTYLTGGACPNSSTFSLVIGSTFDASITGVGPFCEYQDTVLLSVVNSGGTFSGQGIVDANLGVFDPATAGPGVHEIIYTITGACGDDDTINISVNAAPNLILSPDTTINLGATYSLNVTGAQSYTWSPAISLSCSDCNSPVASPSATTTYCVVGTSNEGCIDTACVTITLTTGCEVFIPEAFSPNGDTHNDKLCVYGNCVSELSLSIFNRWGEKVFETTTLGDCWDGTYKGEPLNTGAFAYILQYTLDSGESFEVKGNISLFR